MRLFPKDRDLSAPAERVELTVRGSDLQLPHEDVHVRLDAFLQHFLHWRSRTSIQQLIKEGFVSVALAEPGLREARGELVVERRPGRKLLHGSRVVIEIPEPLRVQRSVPAASDLVVLYEDGEIVVVDKPPMLPVHPSGRHLSDTLIQRIHARYGKDPRREHRIKLCHRLDRETSGIVVCARDPATHAAIMSQFENRDVEKEYHAIVRGVPESDSGVVDLPIGPARWSEVMLRMTTTPDGLPSRTAWSVLERHRGCALVSCRPTTGRQHQIRVHMEAIGHPLVGDKLYGDDETIFLRAAQGELTREDLRALGMPRQALHNHRIAFRNPRTGERVEVRSPIPEDMRAYLEARGDAERPA
ncbi:MAG: RluA family pseudouridine synthase [Planctomycetota bacterium]